MLDAEPGAAFTSLNCTLSPSLTGSLTAGTTADCVLVGATIPLTIGTRAWISVFANATGLSLANTIDVAVTASVA